jgi:hypothetical protein
VTPSDSRLDVPAGSNLRVLRHRRWRVALQGPAVVSLPSAEADIIRLDTGTLVLEAGESPVAVLAGSQEVRLSPGASARIEMRDAHNLPGQRPIVQSLGGQVSDGQRAFPLATTDEQAAARSLLDDGQRVVPPPPTSRSALPGVSPAPTAAPALGPLSFVTADADKTPRRRVLGPALAAREAPPPSAPLAAPSSPVATPFPETPGPSEPAPLAKALATEPSAFALGPRPADSSGQRQSAGAAETTALEVAVTALRQHGNPRVALRLLDEANARFPHGSLHIESATLRAEALVALGDKAQALRTLDALSPKTTAFNRRLRVARGELRADQGHCLEAIDDFDHVLAQTPRDDEDERALRGRSVCLIALRATSAARSDLELYARQFPNKDFARQAQTLLQELNGKL